MGARRKFPSVNDLRHLYEIQEGLSDGVSHVCISIAEEMITTLVLRSAVLKLCLVGIHFKCIAVVVMGDL